MIRTPVFSGSTSALLTAILCLVLVPPAPPVLHAAAGDLDPTFGKGGKVTTGFPGDSNDAAFGVAVQPDGRIVAAGISVGTSVQFGLARYNRDGSLDTTFGDGGTVRTGFRDWEMAVGVDIQRDGKIVAAGTSLSPDGLSPSGFAVARYNCDGSLDATFGDGGKIVTEFPNDTFTEARAMTIQPDGRILVVGTAWGPTGMTTDLAIARYTKDGSLDPSLGGGGTVIANVDQEDDARAVAVSFDGRITVAGSTRGLLQMNSDIAVVRLRRDGSLDTTFGAGGIVRTNAMGQQEFANSVQIQRDGRIVVAGSTIGTTPWFTEDVVLARYNPDGSLDQTFGKGGIVVADLEGAMDEVSAAALQIDGKILVGTTNFTVSRFDANGSLDPTFGAGGIAHADFSTPDAHLAAGLTALAIQRDGRIVAAGGVSDFTTFTGSFALARFDASSASPAPR